MKRFSKNFISILLSDVGRRVFGFLTLAYLTRRISVGDFGAMSIGMTALSYAMMASSGGLSTFGTRAIARGESLPLVSSIVSLRFVISFVAYLVLGTAAVLFVSNSLTIQFILLFGLSLFPNALFLDWYFQGKEHMGIIGIARIISAIFYLVLILLFVHSPENLFWVAIAALIGDTLASAAFIVAYKRKTPYNKLRFDLGEWKSILSQAFPLGIGSILGHFSVNAPPIILGIMLTNTEVGIYSAAGKLVFFLLMFDRVFANLLLPASTRLHAVSSDILSVMLRTAQKWIVVFALPLCVGGTLLADRILPFVFGSQYLAAADTFRILVWYFFFTLVHTIFTSGLVAIGKEGIYGKVMILSAIVYGTTVILGTFLFGVNGAAGAMVFSEAATLILMRRQFVQFVNLPMPLKVLVKSVVAVIFMSIAVLVFPTTHILLLVFFGGCVYTVAIFALRAIIAADVADLLRRV